MKVLPNNPEQGPLDRLRNPGLWEKPWFSFALSRCNFPPLLGERAGPSSAVALLRRMEVKASVSGRCTSMNHPTQSAESGGPRLRLAQRSSQSPGSRVRGALRHGIWGLFGVWSLVFGFSPPALAADADDPASELASFRVADGFKVNLFASEQDG